MNPQAAVEEHLQKNQNFVLLEGKDAMEFITAMI
jgi:hypothetical protein